MRAKPPAYTFPSMTRTGVAASRVIDPETNPLTLALPALLCLAGAKLLLQLVFSGRYGYFRDELYYSACGEHLAWGYIDHAPFVALIARLSRATLGDSLFALRFHPALAAAAKVYLSGWMARELNGGRFAQLIAALITLVAP